MVAAGGALGSVARFAISHGLKSHLLATLAVNLVGAFLIGLVVATAPQWASYETEKLITAGCLGGLTTFSTFSLEVFQLIESKNLGVAVAYGLGSVVLGVLGVALGFKLGS